MYGPYPAFSFNDKGQLDAATGTLYWILSSTYNGTDTYTVVVSYIGRDIILHNVTCVLNIGSNIGNGAPTGRLLRASNGDLFISVESGYGYSSWYQFDHLGTYISDTGQLSYSGGPLTLCEDAALDGLGNLIHLSTLLGHSSATVLTTSPLTVGGSVALTYDGYARITIGASNTVWILSTDGTDGAIDLLDVSGPSITPYSLGVGGVNPTFDIEYDPDDDTLLFWWNSLLNKWSCSTHAIVNSISASYDGSGPLQAGLLTSGIGFYVASSLAVSPITGVGFNPGLPTFGGGTAFKHFYDSGLQVIWLQADDTNVYGAILGGFPLLTTCISATLTLNIPFGAYLTATGGTPPYTFSIISGSLPPLLVLNSSTGAITGVPTVPGAYPYTSQVTDSLGVTAINSCVFIVPQPVAPQSSPMPTVEVTRDLDANWGDESVFYITQDEPFPFTLRGIVLRMSYNQD